MQVVIEKAQVNKIVTALHTKMQQFFCKKSTICTDSCMVYALECSAYESLLSSRSGVEATGKQKYFHSDVSLKH